MRRAVSYDAVSETGRRYGWRAIFKATSTSASGREVFVVEPACGGGSVCVRDRLCAPNPNEIAIFESRGAAIEELQRRADAAQDDGDRQLYQRAADRTKEVR